jgi:outer membrane protein assembly factor BamB
MGPSDLVFIGANGRVVALIRDSGELVWQWTYGWPRWMMSGFVSLVPDGDQLFVAVNGFVYCLNARTGAQIWSNPLRGLGYGHTTIVTGRPTATPAAAAAATGIQPASRTRGM